MGYTIERNESGKITKVEVNGKPIKAGYMRGIRKAQETSYWREVTSPTVGMNRFTGVEVPLNPIEATIYNFCMNWVRRYENGINPEAPIQTFDDMKYFFLNLNNPAYMELLD